MLFKYGTGIFKEHLLLFLRQNSPFLELPRYLSTSQPARDAATNHSAPNTNAEAAVNKPAPDAEPLTTPATKSGKVSRRCGGAGDFVVSLFQLSLEEIDDCVRTRASLQRYASLIKTFFPTTSDGQEESTYNSSAHSKSVTASSARIAELLRWLCPQLCTRLLRSWQARHTTLTKYLQQQLVRFVAISFKDMQSLMAVMKQPAFAGAQSAMTKRMEIIKSELEEFRQWLATHEARKREVRQNTLARIRTVQAEARYFWVSSRQHLCRKWMHHSKQLACLLWDSYRMPGGLWSSGTSECRYGTLVLKLSDCWESHLHHCFIATCRSAAPAERR